MSRDDEVANYFETLGMFWKKGLVDPDLAIEWPATALYWKKIGPILMESRKVFAIDTLWEDFEALAKASM